MVSVVGVGLNMVISLVRNIAVESLTVVGAGHSLGARPTSCGIHPALSVSDDRLIPGIYPGLSDINRPLTHAPRARLLPLGRSFFEPFLVSKEAGP